MTPIQMHNIEPQDKIINKYLEEGEKVLHLEAGTNLVVDQGHQFRLSQPHQSLPCL